MGLTWREVIKCLAGYLEISETRSMSLNRLCFRLTRLAALTSEASNDKVKFVTFDRTCDVICVPLIQFCNIFAQFMPAALKYRFRVENRYSRLADSGEGRGFCDAPHKYWKYWISIGSCTPKELDGARKEGQKEPVTPMIIRILPRFLPRFGKFILVWVPPKKQWIIFLYDYQLISFSTKRPGC